MWIKISRKGDIIPNQQKCSALCCGGHGVGNNSQSDCLLFLYEKSNNSDTRS